MTQFETLMYKRGWEFSKYFNTKKEAILDANLDSDGVNHE